MNCASFSRNQRNVEHFLHAPTFLDNLQMLLLYKRSSEQILVHPLKHYLNNIAMQKVLFHCHNCVKRANNRQTILILRSVNDDL